MPYARVILIQGIKEESPDERILGLSHSEILQKEFGIKLKHNTCKIEKSQDDGLFYKNGLKYDSNKVGYDISIANKNTMRKKSDDKERFAKWVITEINGEFINYKCSAEEVCLFFGYFFLNVFFFLIY